MSVLGILLWGQMWIKIGDYAPGATLSIEYTCDGGNVPPPIHWGGAPRETQAYVLRMYDPDAPADTFIHWIVYNLMETQTGHSSQNLLQGYNDFGKVGYGGPCPPPKDGAHRYVVEVYALQKPLSIKGAVTWERIRSAMVGKVLDQAQTFVVYKRQKP
ncbi:MAG: YbhB/YbcL family Raf kinase inhibitor-like protein [Bacteroidia bacterium]|nr:YbhB/YbcL family Raf kinase inhibitor-like protein [Bacteroidia bacterium]